MVRLAASLPALGSVRPKAMNRSPAATPGRYACFWASVPERTMGAVARELAEERKRVAVTDFRASSSMAQT